MSLRIAFTVSLVTVVLASAAALHLKAADEDKSTSEDKNASTASDPQAKERFFEMRTYYASPGRLDALNQRFREHTNRLFVKHGMDLIGYWVPADGKETLIYILAYPDRESRDRSWKAFMDDPEWKKAYAESQKDGVPLAAKVESVFLKPTDYSPIQ